MRRHLGSTLLAMGLLAGCGGTEAPPSSEAPARQQAPLTETDVDVAPECQGILDFVNQASFEALDTYLPSDAAANLVARRDVSPFVSLADVSSVRLIGPARLQEIDAGARSMGFTGPSCVGIRDDLAVSADDEAAMVSLVNSISDSELHDILPNAWNGAVNLLAQRPYTSSLGISNTSGIGSVSFRGIRNAATLSRPFEALVAAVNAGTPSDYGATMARHFDWYNTLWNAANGYRLGSIECFGLDPQYLPEGTSIRANLADAAEVHADVAHAVAVANGRGAISQTVIDDGMANLDARLAGRSFQGCYVSYADDPWSGNDLAFFVDPVTGFSVKTETFWSE